MSSYAEQSGFGTSLSEGIQHTFHRVRDAIGSMVAQVSTGPVSFEQSSQILLSSGKTPGQPFEEEPSEVGKIPSQPEELPGEEEPINGDIEQPPPDGSRPL